MMISNSVKQIDVLVIDPHPLFREGLKRVLEIDRELRIIAEGENGDQVLALYEQHQPDVVMLEVNLQHKNGIEVLHELTTNFPLSKVLLFTVVDDFFHVSQAIQAGASGYLLKEMDSVSIASAIKTVVRGGFYLHPNLTAEFLAEFNKLSVIDNKSPFFQTEVVRPYHLLTARESEVLQLLADGHSNKSLGEVLNISVKTVKNHVSTILRKMNVHDRTQVVVEALKKGWVELR